MEYQYDKHRYRNSQAYLMTQTSIDNSECGRNGDYLPSRLEAQRDAANLICGTKTASNPESAVGLLTTAGDRVQVRVAPTQDLGKMLKGLHEIPIEGEADILRAVQTAQLALKHRMNKNQKQRILLFVGSPVTASEKQLEQLGRTLKKNNISLDIISFGEVEENSSRLHKLHNAVNTNNTSHIIECPVDASRLLSDVLMGSPVIRGSEVEQSGSGEESGVLNELGVDPTTDPELYMALQLSLQEERNRQAAQQQATAGETVRGETTEPESSQMPPSAAEIEAMEGIDDELRQALLLSINDYQPLNEPQQEAAPDHKPLASDSVDLVAGNDVGIVPAQEAAKPVGCDAAREATNEEIASSSNTATPPLRDIHSLAEEGSALHQIIGTLPGIDMTDPRLLEALQQVFAGTDEGKKDEEMKDKEKEDEK